eukprot:Blabericola_migrator_1__277@NODE_1071_length_5534_cov_423_499909_g734_i0_p2_GENE_NODE_1071_length_5534_cov_423_499909_g734_i0NODE_1071_length_5534_cov_423_499909_g734_i0_p2_ORF_typecomplete_len272_score33_47_NODE_1071_length_5534_cov_423_499909_g734_i06121427
MLHQRGLFVMCICLFVVDSARSRVQISESVPPRCPDAVLSPQELSAIVEKEVVRSLPKMAQSAPAFTTHSKDSVPQMNMSTLAFTTTSTPTPSWSGTIAVPAFKPAASFENAMSVPQAGWISQLQEASNTLVSFMRTLGLSTESDATSDSQECPESNAATLALCAFDRLFRVVSIARTIADVVQMNTRLLAGGKKARDALVHLHTLVGEPYGLEAMRVLKTNVLLSVLARKESTPDYTRGLALSLQTYLTGIPGVVAVDDVATGSFTHTNM